jgi:hypothetical protein
LVGSVDLKVFCVHTHFFVGIFYIFISDLYHRECPKLFLIFRTTDDLCVEEKEKLGSTVSAALQEVREYSAKVG